VDSSDFHTAKHDASRVVHQQTSSSRQVNSHKHKWIKLLVIPLIVVVVLLIGLYAGAILLLHNNQQATGAGTINHSENQAVFLTNGQVYFGKLQTANQYYLKLENIYYLQIQQSVQPASTNGVNTPTTNSTTANSSATNDSSAQLVKLGNELHGPEDEMTIMRSQVMFWENMKPDSKVSKAIAQYKATH
jgi:hypothetical protein